MMLKSLLPLFLLGTIGLAPAPIVQNPASASQRYSITADYVEARTASVFCGPCHYNGELVTDGKQAIVAWSVSAGDWCGVDLAGVRVVAEINCASNLSDPSATRSTDVRIDRGVTDPQFAAIADLFRSRFAAQLGQLRFSRDAAVSFSHDDDGYRVAAEGFAALIVHPMPNHECCTEPHLVWYSPITPIENRRVGYTEKAAYSVGTNGDAWDRSDENSAFYGSLSIRE